ncbi:hypothetical protein JXO52_08115 [bacterium]|nr:hypothetical protein [bacterium]
MVPPAEALFTDAGGSVRSAASRLPGGGRIVVNTFIHGALSSREPDGVSGRELMRRYAAFLVTAAD